jgi:hypothetical protein
MLRLKGAFSNNPRSAPLVEGAVQVQGVDIRWETGFKTPVSYSPRSSGTMLSTYSSFPFPIM